MGLPSIQCWAGLRNEEIAELLNEKFVCINVDKDEYPDLENYYQQSNIIFSKGEIPEKAPEKKIIRYVRSYNKPLDGVFDIHHWSELIPLLNSF